MFNSISGIPITESSSYKVSSKILCNRDSLFLSVDTKIQYKYTCIIHTEGRTGYSCPPQTGKAHTINRNLKTIIQKKIKKIYAINKKTQCLVYKQLAFIIKHVKCKDTSVVNLLYFSQFVVMSKRQIAKHKFFTLDDWMNCSVSRPENTYKQLKLGVFYLLGNIFHLFMCHVK